MISKDSKIYIAGHKGMVGSACWRIFSDAGYKNLIGLDSKSLDLRESDKVKGFLLKERPHAIVDAAARVGGILANRDYPYNFLMENMLIQNNLIRAAHELNIEKFIFLGSSCIYPKYCEQPIKERYLLSGALEETNQWYAIAKISGLKLVEALNIQFGRKYIALMPTNLFGPNDNFNIDTSHVIPALINKINYAKNKNISEVTLWGSGSPKREFLYVDDLARAILFSLENPMNEIVYNVGSGDEITIKELALRLKQIIGFEGDIKWDKNKPDGTPRKLLDSSKLNDLGWQAKVDLNTGLNLVQDFYLKGGVKN